MSTTVIQQQQFRPFVNGHNMYRSEQVRASPRIISTRPEELGSYTASNTIPEEMQTDVTLRVREMGSLYPYLALLKDLSYDLSENDLPTIISSEDFAEKTSHFVFSTIARNQIKDITPQILQSYEVKDGALSSIGWSWNVDGSSTITFSFQGLQYTVLKGSKSATIVERKVKVSSGVAELAQTPTKILQAVAEQPADIAGKDITDVTSISVGNSINIGSYEGVAPTMVSVVYTYDQPLDGPALFYGQLLTEQVSCTIDGYLTISHPALNLVSVRAGDGTLISGATLINDTTIKGPEVNVSGETPSGVIDGVDTTFTLSETPIVAGSVSILVDGTTSVTDNGDGTLSDGGTIDYDTGSFTLVSAPTTSVSADYTYIGGIELGQGYYVNYITDVEPNGLLQQVLKDQVKIYLADSYASKGSRIIGISSANANVNFNVDSRQELGSKGAYLLVTQLPADVTCDITLDETENIEDIYNAILTDTAIDEYDFLESADTRNLYVEILDRDGNTKLIYKFTRLMINNTDSGAELKTTSTRTLNFVASDFYITNSPPSDF